MTFLQRIRRRENWILPAKNDPRWIFVCFHSTYVLLGHLLLNFNRSPEQIAIAIGACALLDVIFTYAHTRLFLFPLSGVITGLGLAILFTAPGNEWLMLLAAWMSISFKYLITWRGHHVFNPTNIALVVLLLFSGGQVAVAPAYQWGGSWQILAVVFGFGCVIMWRAKKLPLVVAFWAAYCVSALLRAHLTHMPAEITLYAQISGGAFWLFSFFMITDPKTSPPSAKGQIVYGVAIAAVDAWFQLNTAVFSLFYALFVVCAARALWMVYLDVVRPRLAGVPA